MAQPKQDAVFALIALVVCSAIVLWMPRTEPTAVTAPCSNYSGIASDNLKGLPPFGTLQVSPSSPGRNLPKIRKPREPEPFLSKESLSDDTW